MCGSHNSWKCQVQYLRNTTMSYDHGWLIKWHGYDISYQLWILLDKLKIVIVIDFGFVVF